VLKGTLDDFTLSDIFRLTALAKKTGRLDVERRTGSGRVYFRDGDVYHAESTKSKELMGSKLTRSGRVTEKQLRRAVIEQEQTGRRLGELLIEQGAVEEEEIEWAVRSQIEDGVFDLLRWDLGAFVWEPDVEIDAEVPLSVSVENLIIEASRRLDEISQIRKKIPSADVVLTMAPRTPEGAHQINITSEEWQVLVLVDGRRSVEDIATSTGAEAYQTTRLLFGLMNAGLIEHKQAESDSNVVELQRDVVEDDAGADRDDRQQTVAAPPAPPPAPRNVDRADPRVEGDRRAGERGAHHLRQREDREEAEASERELKSTEKRFKGPSVDRAVVVRELAGLFSEGNKPRPRAVPSGDKDKDDKASAPKKRRVEDDDQVDGKLIGRMIDGVKEL
jgi:hypothetical protein